MASGASNNHLAREKAWEYANEMLALLHELLEHLLLFRLATEQLKLPRTVDCIPLESSRCMVRVPVPVRPEQPPQLVVPIHRQFVRWQRLHLFCDAQRLVHHFRVHFRRDLPEQLVELGFWIGKERRQAI
jgi:hypothetical protein